MKAKLNMTHTRQEAIEEKQEVQGTHTLTHRLMEPREQRKERESEGREKPDTHASRDMTGQTGN